MNKYKKLLLIALALIIIGFLIPNSLHINDYYNTFEPIDCKQKEIEAKENNSTLLGCHEQDTFFLNIIVFLLPILGIIAIILIFIPNKRKDKEL